MCSKRICARARAAWRRDTEGKVFLTVHVPPTRLVITGAVHISQALAPIASLLGYDVTIVDPRTAFASVERFPDVKVIAEWPDKALPPLGIDRYTAFVALTHDPKIDDPALLHALERDCFYIGALGSKKTHARRVERLKGAGRQRCAACPRSCADRASDRCDLAAGDRRCYHGRDHEPPAAHRGGQAMKFGALPPREAEGAIAVHSIRKGGMVLKKGTLIGKAEVAALEAAKVSEIVVARLEPGDVSEDVAAAEIAAAGRGRGRACGPRVHGPRQPVCRKARACWSSTRSGVDALNDVDPSITFATLNAYAPVVAGKMIATVKIIPFAVAGAARDKAVAAARGAQPIVRVAPFKVRKVGIISTVLPGLADKVIEKTLKVTEERLAPAGAVDRGRAARAARDQGARQGARRGAEGRRRDGGGVRRLGDRRYARRDSGGGRAESAGASSISACRSIPAT